MRKTHRITQNLAQKGNDSEDIKKILPMSTYTFTHTHIQTHFMIWYVQRNTKQCQKCDLEQVTSYKLENKRKKLIK